MLDSEKLLLNKILERLRKITIKLKHLIKNNLLEEAEELIQKYGIYAQKTPKWDALDKPHYKIAISFNKLRYLIEIEYDDVYIKKIPHSELLYNHPFIELSRSIFNPIFFKVRNQTIKTVELVTKLKRIQELDPYLEDLN